MLKYVLHVILLFGIYGPGSLAYKQFSLGNICPKILGIPACYIILTCFVISFFIHLFGQYHKVYFAMTGLAWMIATFASVMQLMGIIECPKTSGGTPMCFISFVIFTTLIVLKAIELQQTTIIQ